MAELDARVDALGDALSDLARKIHGQPELSFEEHKAAQWIAEMLEREGAKVERQLGGLDTALRARLGDGTGPRVAILAEYDALPEIGHACGHNLIAAGAVGAWLALQAAHGQLGGTVDLIGTPAEEGGGGKILLAAAGIFSGLDAAMMFHPFDRDLSMHPTLASAWLDLRFEGRPSHAAMAPQDGASALTACMDCFRLIDGQRVHFRDGVRVHGIIKEGGEAVNIVPERASSELSVRAPEREELDRVCAIVERCARAAAMASDVSVGIERRMGYRDMRNNLPLAVCFEEQLETLGRKSMRSDPQAGAGSTDMGDVSHIVPSLHPWLAICDEGSGSCHERVFADYAASERGIEAMLLAAKAMARTVAKLLLDAELRQRVRSAFER